MAKQAERRAATTEAILKAGRRLFGERGFAATTIDDIAESAQVAKGAVYHHFATKEAVFEAVFDVVSRDLVADIDRMVRTEKDVLAAMVAGTQHYFAACAKGPTCQIILRDGPAVRDEFHRLLTEVLQTANIQADPIDGCGPARVERALGLLQAR